MRFFYAIDKLDLNALKTGNEASFNASHRMEMKEKRGTVVQLRNYLKYDEISLAKKRAIVSFFCIQGD